MGFAASSARWDQKIMKKKNNVDSSRGYSGLPGIFANRNAAMPCHNRTKDLDARIRAAQDATAMCSHQLTRYHGNAANKLDRISQPT